MPLRVALTGQLHGPELAPLFKLIQPEMARRRFELHAQNP
jgi:glutamyl/glutaminyl-tRNA synthetase